MSMLKRQEIAAKLKTEFDTQSESFVFMPGREVSEDEMSAPRIYSGLLTYWANDSQGVRSIYYRTPHETLSSRSRFLVRYSDLLRKLQAHPEAARDSTNDIIIARAGNDLHERKRSLFTNIALISGAENPAGAEDYFLGSFVSTAVCNALRFSLRDAVIARPPEIETPEVAGMMQTMATNSHDPDGVATTSLRIVSGYLPSPLAATVLCARTL